MPRTLLYQILNSLGYGAQGSDLLLDLVYNPGGAFLAPEQHKLEGAYRQELSDAHGIVFSHLLCLNNMPIKRFVDFLQVCRYALAHCLSVFA